MRNRLRFRFRTAKRLTAFAARMSVSGSQILYPDGEQAVLRGTNQGTWGQNYANDAADIRALGANLVRIVGVRWWGDSYETGVDSYSSDPAQHYISPSHLAQALQEVDWAVAAGLNVVFVFDSDNGAGNRGLGVGQPNFFESDSESLTKLAQWKEMQRYVMSLLRLRKNIVCLEILAEPMPTGSNTSHAPILRDFYRDLITNARTVDPLTPFLIGPRASYGVNQIEEILLPERTDVIYTGDFLTNKVSTEGTFAGFVETMVAFRDAHNVPILFQQIGRNSSDDIGDLDGDLVADTTENLTLTALCGALSKCNAHGIPFTHWQYKQNTANAGAYALLHKTVYPGSGADNWTPKQNELAVFAYHMRQTGALLEAEAIAAATAANANLYYIKSDFSNIFQTNDTSTPVTAIGQSIGRINPVVGTGNLSQATSGLRPVLAASVNGHAMQFTAASNMWLGHDTTYFASGDNTIVIMAARPAASAVNRVMFQTGTSGTNVRYPYVAVIATDQVQASWRGDDTNPFGAQGVTTSDDRAIVVSATKIGDDKKVFINGVQEGTTDTNLVGSIATITRTRVGATSAGTNGFGGPIALVCISKTMTDEQRRAIERWGAWLVAAPFRGAIPVETWTNRGLMAVNVHGTVDFDPTMMYRNLRNQLRAYCPLSDGGGYGESNVTLQTSGVDKGYPVNGTDFICVFAANTVAHHAGTYLGCCKGDNPPTLAGDGVLSNISYNAGTNRTTWQLAVDATPGQNLALRFGSSGGVSGFGDLQFMQPSYALDDPNLFTPEAVAHYKRWTVLRGMDLLKTNDSSNIPNWEDSPGSKDDMPGQYQHSVQALVDLCVATGAEPWANIPARATSAHKEAFLSKLFTALPGSAMATVEYGNELWNYAFDGYWYVLSDALTLANAWIGYNGGQQDKIGRRVVSVSRVGTEVTIQLSGAHNISPGATFYDHSDVSEAITPGSRVATAGTTGSTITFTHPDSGNTTGVVDSVWMGSYVYLNPTHELVKPLTTWGNPNTWPDPTAVKSRYHFIPLRDIYDIAVRLGVQYRMRLRLGHQLDEDTGPYYAIHGLAFAREKYGSLDWLFLNEGGLVPAYYMQPSEADVDNITTMAAVFTALETDRARIAPIFTRFVNAVRQWGQRTIAMYEGGPHNDQKHTATIATAVRAAHLDDGMRVLVKNLYQDALNRGLTGPFAYFHGGTTQTFDGVSFGGSNNNTWALIEAAPISNVTQPKMLAQIELASATPTVSAIAGVNSGAILFKNVIFNHADAGTSVVNNQLLVGNNARSDNYGISFYLSAAASVVIDLKAGTNGGTNTDRAALVVDGVQRGADFALPNVDDFSVATPGIAVTRTVPLTKGWHFASVDIGTAPRTGYISLYELTLT